MNEVYPHAAVCSRNSCGAFKRFFKRPRCGDILAKGDDLISSKYFYPGAYIIRNSGGRLGGCTWQS